MKPFLLAIVLSITLHFLAFFILKNQKIDEFMDKPSSSKQVNKSSVHFVRLQSQPKPQIKPEIVKPKPVKKSEPKPIIKKEYKKVKKIVKQSKRSIIKKPAKKIARKPIEKTEVTPNYQKLNPTKLQKKTLTDYLTTPVLDFELLDEMTQSYLKLYGEEYNSFTKVQKVFLQKNLKDIGRITQQYLKYPRIAIRLRKAGMNTVEFMLHPNGDISNLRITTPSGYSFFDEQTLETVEFAYKDYPRPTQKTKVKIYVRYILY